MKKKGNDYIGALIQYNLTYTSCNTKYSPPILFPTSHKFLCYEINTTFFSTLKYGRNISPHSLASFGLLRKGATLVAELPTLRDGAFFNEISPVGIFGFWAAC